MQKHLIGFIKVGYYGTRSVFGAAPVTRVIVTKAQVRHASSSFFCPVH